MKFVHIITLAALFITLTSAQSIDDIADDEGNKPEGSDVGESPEDYGSVASISFSVGSGDDDDFGVVEHGDENLIRVIKTVDGQLTTEYFTIVDVDVKSTSEDGQNDEEASAIDDEMKEHFFGNFEGLGLEDIN